MPSGLGPMAVFTTSDPGGGRQYTRFRGPIFLGMSVQGDLATTGGSAGASVNSPSIINFSSLRGDMLVSVTSTAVLSFQISSSQYNVSTGSPTGIVYISMSTGSGNMVAAGSTANAPVGLPGGANGVGLVWDGNMKTLAVYDPASSAWMWPHQLGSSGLASTIVWSACSS